MLLLPLLLPLLLLLPLCHQARCSRSAAVKARATPSTFHCLVRRHLDLLTLLVLSLLLLKLQRC
jgi:hypothetical protein